MKEEKREQWREGRRKTNEGRKIENKYTEKEERKKRRGNWVNRKEVQTWEEQREGRSGKEGVRGETGGAEVGVPRYPSLLGVDPDLPPPLQLLGPQCPPPHQGGCGRGHRGGGDGGQPLVITSPQGRQSWRSLCICTCLGPALRLCRSKSGSQSSSRSRRSAVQRGESQIRPGSIS